MLFLGVLKRKEKAHLSEAFFILRMVKGLLHELF